ncbi:substrate binding domain-containing protein, partial [Cedecea davisae]
LLRVAAPVAFGAMHLGRIVSRYLEQFPEVSLDVVLEDKYADLLENRIDVAIRVGRFEDPTLVTRRLAPCRMVLCASPEYLKKHGTPETPDDLSRAPRLAFSQAVSAGDWTIYDAQGRPHSIEGPCRMTANNIQLLLESVLATELTIQAVYPSAIRIPFKVRSFVDFIAKALGDTPLWGEEN